MIALNDKNKSFMFRVAGVILHNNKILLQKAIRGDSWVLPGGRAEVFEMSSDTIKREMREELGIEVSVNRILWIAENFNAYGAIGLHEFALYYLIDIDKKCDICDKVGLFEGAESNVELIFKWHDFDELETLNIYPIFLKSSLKNIPTTIQHITNHDY